MASAIVYEFDGSRIHDLESFYAEVSRVMLPGTSWGCNLDAFNDILRGDFGALERNFTIVWRGADESRKRLGHAETVRVLERRQFTCHPSNRCSLAEQLAAARRGEGQTIFETLLEIIGNHPEVKLVLA